MGLELPRTSASFKPIPSELLGFGKSIGFPLRALSQPQRDEFNRATSYVIIGELDRMILVKTEPAGYCPIRLLENPFQEKVNEQTRTIARIGTVSRYWQEVAKEAEWRKKEGKRIAFHNLSNLTLLPLFTTDGVSFSVAFRDHIISINYGGDIDFFNQLRVPGTLRDLIANDGLSKRIAELREEIYQTSSPSVELWQTLSLAIEEMYGNVLAKNTLLL